MATVITPENWKDFRHSEATERFPLESLVQYNWGFTRIEEGNFGKVLRITKSGNIYVAKVELKEAGRNPLKHPADCQLAGWFDYDPSQMTAVEDQDPLKFMARLESQLKWTEPKGSPGIKAYNEYGIGWRGPKGSGVFDLHVPVIGENGFIRAKYDGFD